jgi:crotonobetainyl-CoA:carnitine CoA-transferase CaiB-like acyl-CoA transferase
MEKWVLGYEALSKANVGLVMLRISGFGQDGPYSALPGYGTLLEAMTGLAHLSGEADRPPMLPGFPTADTITGLVAFGACMTALWGWDRQGGSGTGTVVDASLYGPLLYLLGSHFVEAAETGRSPGRRGNHQGNTPRNAVQCSDGKWLAYSEQSFKVIRGLVEILNLEHDERLNDPACGYLYGNELDRKTVEHVKGMERSAAMAELQAHGVPVAPINDLVEIMNDVHMRARSEFNPVRDRSRPGKTVLMPTSPVRLRNSPGVVGFTGARLGEDTASVLSELLGITGPEMERLRRAGVI